MNLVDFSGWLEYFGEGANAQFFASAIETADKLIVPAICVYEVFKNILRQRDEQNALKAAFIMEQAQVIPVDFLLSLKAAKLSYETKLPMADSIILATAGEFNATLWTQDTVF